MATEAAEEQTKEPPKPQGISLWAFVALVGGVGAVVGGYLYLKKRSSLPIRMPMAESLSDMARDALLRSHAFAQAATAGGCGNCGRDLTITAADPRLGAKYFLSGN